MPFAMLRGRAMRGSAPDAGRPACGPAEDEGQRRVLFLSYDGMTDPLGASQVLPYLRGLAGRGHCITLVSFEKPGRPEEEWGQVRVLCREAGIRWHPLRYHKWPPVLSTMVDVAVMKRKARSLHHRHRFEIVHCRSYIAALAGLWMKRRYGIRFLFDMRGFWAEERVEGGRWNPSNPLFAAVYRFFKRCEAQFLAEADAIVSLTRNARDEMATRPMGQRPSGLVEVIPCCVDFDHFSAPDAEQKRAARAKLGIAADRPVLGYVGSLGGNYMLDEMLSLFLAYRERHPGALFLFVTHHPPGDIHRAAGRLGIGANEILVRPASRDEVPRFTAAADVGVAFKQPSFSAKACSPTKLGELMALGIPVIANAGVGDVAEILADTGAGVVVDRFDRQSLSAAVDAAIPLAGDPDQIRAGARRWFALEDGIEAYDRLYRALCPAEELAPTGDSH